MISIALLLYVLPALFITQLASNYWRLRHVPGPFLAGCTDLWRLLLVWGRKAEVTHLKLHEKYGDIIRLGPNCVSVTGPDSDVARSIYGFKHGFIKSDFYYPFQNIVNGKRVASLVAMVDETQHAATRRPVAPAYSLSTLVEYEPLVDSTISVLFAQLDERFASSRAPCDLGLWLQFFAFDVIGELTFSKRLGFLEQGDDVEGIMGSIAANFDRTSVIGQMPWIDLLWWKNPLYTTFFARKAPSNPILTFGQRRLLERLNPDTSVDGDGDEESGLKFEKEKEQNGSVKSKPDFLSRFLAVRDGEPDVISDSQLLGYLFMNVNAGSDTVAVTARAIMYHLLKNPSSIALLHTELSNTASKGHLSLPLPTWSQTQNLPYLNAVIKEALRIHPALGLPLERIAPASGLHLPVPSPSGSSKSTFLPAGTIVGTNPWVLQRDTRIYGPDAASWNPSRWLDADEVQLKLMDHSLLTFGGGKRTCLGRNIAMLELHKVVPALVMRYEIRLEEPGREWKTFNSWIVRQEGLRVLLEKRGKEGM